MWSVWLLSWVLQRKEKSGRGSQASQETTGESLARDTFRAPSGGSSPRFLRKEGRVGRRGQDVGRRSSLLPIIDGGLRREEPLLPQRP